MTRAAGGGQRERRGPFPPTEFRVCALALVAVAWLAACPEQPAAPVPAPPAPRRLETVVLPPVASLTEAEGRVDLERDGGRAAASPGPVFEGDAIVTGADGRALLSDEGGRQLELGPDTRFTVGAQLSAIEVLQGDFRILSSGRSGIGSVRTPYGEASLAPGTNGRLGIADGGLRLEVLEGTFVILGLDGGVGAGGRGSRLELLPGTFQLLGSGGAAANGLRLEVLEGTFTIIRPDGGPASAGRGERLEVFEGTFTIVRPDGGLVDTGRGALEVLPGTSPGPAPDDGPVRVGTGARLAPSGGPQSPAAPRAQGVRLVVEGGRPLVKGPGQATFAPARSGDEVAPGTQLRAGGGALRLEGAGARVLLRGGAAGVAEGVRDVEGGPALALARFIGPLTVQLEGKGRGVAQVDDVIVGGAGEATGAVTEAGKKRRFEVQAGSVELVVGGVPRPLRAGEVALVEGTRVTVLEVRPGLVVNGVSRVQVHADGVASVAIALPDETNRVEVARDEGFSAPFISGVVGRQVLVPGLKAGTLFFRTTDPSGAPRAQGRLDFLSDLASQRDTATRSDVVGETGQRATVYFQSKVPALTFAFKPFEGAKAWQFQLCPALALDRPLVDRRAPEARLTLEPGTLSEGAFVWSATPLDGSGAPLSSVQFNKLDIRYDNARTTLLIERPLAGERAGPDVRASGVTPERSQLFVNGRLVVTDDQGRFSVPVGGGDAVLFRVVMGATESYWLRRLKR